MSQYGSVKAYGWELNRCRDATVRVSTYVDVGKQLLNRIDLCPTQSRRIVAHDRLTKQQ